MRVDGTGRELLSTSAADVVWWSDGSLFIWTPAHNAILRRADGTERPIDVRGVVSVQPNGLLGVRVRLSGGAFTREIVDLETGMTVVALGADRPYFNAHAWSPDGSRLAFVSPVVLNPNSGMIGSEIFLYTPRGIPQPVTNLSAAYGAVRINGLSVGELSWSPDGSRIAFWVTEMLSGDPEGHLGQAIIHMLDVNTGAVTAYCGYGTNEHTPNPPRLVWSPDGNYLAFGGIVPDDAESGYHLLALEVETGIFTSLSRGVAVVFGAPNVARMGDDGALNERSEKGKPLLELILLARALTMRWWLVALPTLIVSALTLPDLLARPSAADTRSPSTTAPRPSTMPSRAPKGTIRTCGFRRNTR
jgi:WD40 repeat protein